MPQIFQIKSYFQKKTKPAFCILLFLTISHITISQNSIFKIPDSLKNKSYEEYASLFYKNQNDSIKAFKYANLYLLKAKNEKNLTKTSHAYSQLASIYGNYNLNISISYCDSIIDLTKNIDHFEYPGFAYMVKGMCLNNLGKYSVALNNYLIASNFALKNKNIRQLFYIKNEIGKLKYLTGNYDEALDIFKSQYILIQSKLLQFDDLQDLKTNTLFNLANSYLLVKKYDSALIYSKKGLVIGINDDNKVKYNLFLSQTGEILYYQNELVKAHDSIVKAFPFETSHNAQFNNHFILGNIFKKQNNNIKAFYHFTKSDSIYNLTNDVVPEVREIQEYFINYYKLKDDTKNQLKYIDRLLYVDSIMHNNHIYLNEIIYKKYDTPLLLSEKQEIIAALKEKEKKASFLIYGLTGVLLFIIIFSVRFIKNQRTYKQRFRKLLFEQKKDVENRINSNELHEISKDIIDSILLDLKKFEKNNDFLNNEITLANLAVDFNTNSSYLSKIINGNKGKNFSTYISDLRIDYCVEKLKTNDKFRRLPIKGIAFEIGFNNTESFSKAFYRKTGIYPSYFIKEIEKKHS